MDDRTIDGWEMCQALLEMGVEQLLSKMELEAQHASCDMWTRGWGDTYVKGNSDKKGH